MAKLKKTISVLILILTAFVITAAFVFTADAFTSVAAAESDKASDNSGNVQNDESAETEYILAPSASNDYAGNSRIPIHDYMSGKFLFYIPQSYYAKIVNENAALKIYIVEYADLTSIYIPSDSLNGATIVSPSFENDISPYPATRLNVIQTFSLNSAEITADYTVKFLGYTENGYYVSATYGDDTYYGEASADNFESILIPLHKIERDYRESLIDNNGGDAADPAKNTSATLRVILIIGIIIPAVLIVILLFKPGKDRTEYDKHVMKKSNRRDDYDYDRDRRYSRGYDRDYVRDRDYENDYSDNDYRRRDAQRDERGYSDFPRENERDYSDRDYRDKRF